MIRSGGNVTGYFLEPNYKMFYIIGGPPRSGKSILCNRLLQDYHVPGISTDMLRALFESGNPDLGISPDTSFEDNATRMWPYLEGFINFTKMCQHDYLLEGDALLPSLLKNFAQDPYCRILFIGFERINPKRKLQNIRDFSEDSDWTSEMLDRELIGMLNGLKQRSKRFREECEIYGIRYIDTSEDFEQAIDEAVQYLLNICGRRRGDRRGRSIPAKYLRA